MTSKKVPKFKTAQGQPIERIELAEISLITRRDIRRAPKISSQEATEETTQDV